MTRSDGWKTDTRPFAMAARVLSSSSNTGSA
jgi:hypothetical protein